jgi:hypothetical protein
MSGVLVSSPMTAVLDDLHAEHDGLTPQTVVSAATNPTSPLHNYFQWDDGKAADSYRLWQARQLIKSIKIERPDGKQMPKYLSVKIGETRRYEEISSLVQDVDKWSAVLADASQSLRDVEKHVDDLIYVARSGKRDRTSRLLKDGVINLRNRFDEALEPDVTPI